MNDIQVFDFEDNAVRVVDIDGAFVLRCSVRFGSSVVRPVAVPFPAKIKNAA